MFIIVGHFTNVKYSDTTNCRTYSITVVFISDFADAILYYYVFFNIVDRNCFGQRTSLAHVLSFIGMSANTCLGLIKSILNNF